MSVKMDCNAVHLQGVEMPAIQGGGGRGSFVDAMTADGNYDVVDVLNIEGGRCCCCRS